MNMTRKMTKQIFAISAAVPATKPKPRTAATSAIIKNRIVLFNIFCFAISHSLDQEAFHLLRAIIRAVFASPENGRLLFERIGNKARLKNQAGACKGERDRSRFGVRLLVGDPLSAL